MALILVGSKGRHVSQISEDFPVRATTSTLYTSSAGSTSQQAEPSSRPTSGVDRHWLQLARQICKIGQPSHTLAHLKADISEILIAL